MLKVNKDMLAQVCGSWKSIPVNPKRFMGYSRIIDTKEYSIYERPLKADKVVAVHGDTVIKQRGKKTLIIIPNARVPTISYRVKLGLERFPGLYEGSSIAQCLLLPYLRNTKKDTYIRDQRLCVITDKGQIFHNKPARGTDFEGVSHPDDIVEFEESVVWDLPGKKHPSNNPLPEEGECYYPGLPEACYQYSPPDNQDKSFKNPYGNGGFGKVKEVQIGDERVVSSRFYLHSRDFNANPFFSIGTGTRTDKVTLIGTYRANVIQGVRICLFASSDGGREWFCKYEFSDTGEYGFQQGYSDAWGTNFGNKIAINAEIDCRKNDLSIYQRNILLPSNADGNVYTEFIWRKISEVSAICGKDETLLTAEEPHGLKTGNIVALQSARVQPQEIEWLRCSQVTPQGTAGGQQFKVKVIDEYTVELYELVSSATPTLPCRHIHHINYIKDGWVIGTGEIYPNGWLLYMQQKQADTYAKVYAGDPLLISRINTTPDSVQRTMGLIIQDNKERQVIFASDHDTLDRKPINFTSLRNVSRGSVGIYVGKLESIDDRNEFDCVYEATQPCYYFQKIADMYIHAGQRGELGICVDPQFKKWYSEQLSRFIMYHMGSYYNYHCFNDYIILRK